MKKTLDNWQLWLMASLTLGLKIRWIFGGAVGMKAIDWFDFLLHGMPWLLFVRALIVKIAKK